jgi:hypothetical protein
MHKRCFPFVFLAFIAGLAIPFAARAVDGPGIGSPPQPVVTGKRFVDPVTKGGNARVSYLPGRVLSLAWMDGAQSTTQRSQLKQFVLIADTDGVVHKVHMPDLVEERRIKLRGCNTVAVSADGILVGGSNNGDVFVWVLNSNLEVQRKFPLEIPRIIVMEHLESRPQLHIAFGWNGSLIYIINSATGKVARTVNPEDLKAHHVPSPAADFGLESISLSDNGKTVFAPSVGAIYRFGVQANDLVYEACTAKLSGNARLGASGDGKLTALANSILWADVTRFRQAFATDIFRGDDLQTPIVRLHMKTYLDGFAINSTDRLAYGSENDVSLVVYGIDSGKRSEHRLSLLGPISEFLLWSDQRKFFVRTRMGNAALVELSD